MVIKQVLLSLFCIITIIYVHAMQPDHPNPLSEEVRKQLCYNQWEKVKQTLEFMDCVDLVRQQCHPSRPEFQDAFKALHETKEFKKYINLINPSNTQDENT